MKRGRPSKNSGNGQRGRPKNNKKKNKHGRYRKYNNHRKGQEEWGKKWAEKAQSICSGKGSVLSSDAGRICLHFLFINMQMNSELNSSEYWNNDVPYLPKKAIEETMQKLGLSERNILRWWNTYWKTGEIFDANQLLKKAPKAARWCARFQYLIIQQ